MPTRPAAALAALLALLGAMNEGGSQPSLQSSSGLPKHTACTLHVDELLFKHAHISMRMYALNYAPCRLIASKLKSTKLYPTLTFNLQFWTKEEQLRDCKVCDWK